MLGVGFRIDALDPWRMPAVKTVRRLENRGMSERLTVFCAACTFRRLTYRFWRSAGVNSGGALTVACSITLLSAWASAFLL